MIELLLRNVLKKYARDFDFLGVGQKTTITRLWDIGFLGRRYKVGLFLERSE